MKKITLMILLLILLPFPVTAGDHMVTYVGEMYRELDTPSNKPGVIYHALQVDTSNGSRLLVLTGSDSVYRGWLREYLVHEHRLILRVPDGDESRFRRSLVFDIDVTAIHPVLGKRWRSETAGAGTMPPFTGDKQVLVVDADQRRRELVEMVVKDLGYPVVSTDNGEEALKMFTLQPDRFCMVIADSRLEGLSGPEMVTRLIKASPDLPVIFGTGYKRNLKELSRAFKNSNKVIVTQALLRELSQNIHELLET